MVRLKAWLYQLAPLLALLLLRNPVPEPVL